LSLKCGRPTLCEIFGNVLLACDVSFYFFHVCRTGHLFDLTFDLDYRVSVIEAASADIMSLPGKGKKDTKMRIRAFPVSIRSDFYSFRLFI